MPKIMQLAKKLSLSITDNINVGSVCSVDDCENKTVARLSLTSKNLNIATSYLTPKAKLAFSQLKKALT